MTDTSIILVDWLTYCEYGLLFLCVTSNILWTRSQESSQTQSNLQTDIVGLRNQLHEQVVMATELEGAVKDRERVAQSARKTLLEVQDRVHALQKEKEEVWIMHINLSTFMQSVFNINMQY